MGIQKDGSIIIDNFQKGISENTFGDFVTMKNMNITDSPGIITAGKVVYPYGPTVIADQTFTAVAATDIITVADTNITRLNGASFLNATGVAVRFTTTDTLPSGLAVDTDYFLIYSSTKNYKVATNYGNADDGTEIDITDAGTGVHTIIVTYPDNIRFFTKNNSGTFGLDTDGNVWLMGTSPRLLPGGGTYKSFGNGLSSFNDFLFVFRSSKIDVLDVSTSAKLEDPVGTSAWTEDWQSLNDSAGSSVRKNSIYSVDGIIYFCDTNYIGKIKELTTFVPATSATYEYNNKALDFPIGTNPSVLEDLGSQLMIGASDSNLYSWDRISTSFNLPIEIPSISSMKTINNVLYILSKEDTSIYATNGVSINRVKKLNDYITKRSSNSSPYQSVNFGNAILENNKLMFGVSINTTDEINNGVYSYNTTTGALEQDYMMDGNTLGKSSSTIGLINSGNGVISMGGSDGYYRNDNSAFYSSYESFFETGLVKIGDALNKKTYSSLIFELEENLNNNEKLKIEYRTTLNGTYLSLAEFDYATYGARNFLEVGTGIHDLTQIQFKVSLQTARGTDRTDVKLRSIIIK